MMEQQIQALLNEITELKSQNDSLKNKLERFEQQYNSLLIAFKDFRRQRFGSRSEKFQDGDNPQLELDLFSEKKSQELCESSLKTKTNDNVISIAAHQRQKRQATKFPAGLPRREVVIPVEDKTCGCGNEKALIRYETTELMNYQPAVFEIIVQKREVVTCKHGCSTGTIEMAENPKRILPKTKITADFLSHIIVSKLHDRQPLYHLEKQLNQRFGIEMPRQTLARWVIDSGQEMQPLVNLLKDTYSDYDVGSVDPTWMQVLREPGRLPTQKSYTYCFRGGSPQKSVIIYEYNAELHKAFLLDWFDGYKGYVLADGQNIFDEINLLDGINMSYCNAHSRRKFDAIDKVTQSSDGLAKVAMRFYRKVYAFEREAKRLELSPQARFEYRLENTKPLFEEHYQWLLELYPTLLPKSPLAKAFYYSIKRWEGLCRFFEDGRLEIDNNLTEQEIKPLALARKNFLFACSVDGVNALCNHMSLLRTAIQHGLEPYQYFTRVFHEIPYCSTADDYELLLPWNIQLQKVGALKAA